jgi:hypothetical protein
MISSSGHIIFIAVHFRGLFGGHGGSHGGFAQVSGHKGVLAARKRKHRINKREKIKTSEFTC